MIQAKNYYNIPVFKFVEVKQRILKIVFPNTAYNTVNNNKKITKKLSFSKKLKFP